eukprot:6487515-Amphidinium_carterae.1
MFTLFVAQCGVVRFHRSIAVPNSGMLCEGGGLLTANNCHNSENNLTGTNVAYHYQEAKHTNISFFRACLIDMSTFVPFLCEFLNLADKRLPEQTLQQSSLPKCSPCVCVCVCVERAPGVFTSG